MKRKKAILIISAVVVLYIIVLNVSYIRRIIPTTKRSVIGNYECKNSNTKSISLKEAGTYLSTISKNGKYHYRHGKWNLEVHAGDPIVSYHYYESVKLEPDKGRRKEAWSMYPIERNLFFQKRLYLNYDTNSYCVKQCGLPPEKRTTRNVRIL